MIFLRTPGGISHDPAESVHLDDVARALECGQHLLTQLAASQEFWGGRAVHNLGQTRSSHQRNHLLLTPDTFVRTALPGMKNACAIVHVGPALGAGSRNTPRSLSRRAELGNTSAQRFLYVMEGA